MTDKSPQDSVNALTDIKIFLDYINWSVDSYSKDEKLKVLKTIHHIKIKLDSIQNHFLMSV